MAMKKYEEYTKQLRALWREAVRIQKAQDRVYAKGCSVVVKSLKDTIVNKWICPQDPYITPKGITELYLLHISSVKTWGTYGNGEYCCIKLSYDNCLLFRFELGDNVPEVYPSWYIYRNINPKVPYYGKGHTYIYVEKDFSLWETETENPFVYDSRNTYVKKTLKYMEDNKL